MGIIELLSIIQVLLVNTLLFTIGSILRRNQDLLVYFGIHSDSESSIESSTTELAGLITLSGKLLQYTAIIAIAMQLFGIFTFSNHSF